MMTINPCNKQCEDHLLRLPLSYSMTEKDDKDQSKRWHGSSYSAFVSHRTGMDPERIKKMQVCLFNILLSEHLKRMTAYKTDESLAVTVINEHAIMLRVLQLMSGDYIDALIIGELLAVFKMRQRDFKEDIVLFTQLIADLNETSFEPYVKKLQQRFFLEQ